MAQNDQEVTLTGTLAEVFSSTNGVSTVVIIVTSGIAEVQINEDMHPGSEVARLDSAVNGGVFTFRCAGRGIKSILARYESGAAAAEIDFFVSAINN